MGRCTSSFALKFGNETDVQGVYILDLNHMPVGCGSVNLFLLQGAIIVLISSGPHGGQLSMTDGQKEVKSIS
jgi:hypothetical protein